MNQLWRENAEPWSTGSAACELLYRLDAWRKLPLAIWRRVGELEPIVTLLDTAAEYSIMGGELAAALQADLTPIGEPDLFYDTRLGRFRCSVRTLRVVIEADDGEGLVIDGITVLVCEQWDGPFTLGMRGALEHIRFAIEPAASVESLSRIFFANGG